jgi:hypothetical protein
VVGFVISAIVPERTGKPKVIDHEKKRASIFSFAASRLEGADHGK